MNTTGVLSSSVWSTVLVPVRTEWCGVVWGESAFHTALSFTLYRREEHTKWVPCDFLYRPSTPVFGYSGSFHHCGPICHHQCRARAVLRVLIGFWWRHVQQQCLEYYVFVTYQGMPPHSTTKEQTAWGCVKTFEVVRMYPYHFVPVQTARFDLATYCTSTVLCLIWCVACPCDDNHPTWHRRTMIQEYTISRSKAYVTSNIPPIEEMKMTGLWWCSCVLV